MLSPQIAALAPVVNAYIAVQVALAADDHAAAIAAASTLRDASTDTPAHNVGQLAGELAKSSDIDAARQVFYPLSTAVIAMVRETGNPDAASIGVAYCPMARSNLGAYWLQRPGPVRNPYYGAEMLACGSLELQVTSGERIGQLKHQRPE